MNLFRKQWRIAELGPAWFVPEWSFPWLPFWVRVDGGNEAQWVGFNTLTEARQYCGTKRPRSRTTYHSA